MRCCPKCDLEHELEELFCNNCGYLLTSRLKPGEEAEEKADPGSPAAGDKGRRDTNIRLFASPWKRLIANFIDLLIVSGLIYSCTLIATSDSIALHALNGAAIFWLYYVLMESSSRQATLGKMLFNIVVTDIQGRQLTVIQSTLRNMVKLFFNLSFVIGVISFFVAIFSKQKQSLHDKLAGCLVLNVAL